MKEADDIVDTDDLEALDERQWAETLQIYGCDEALQIRAYDKAGELIAVAELDAEEGRAINVAIDAALQGMGIVDGTVH